MPLPSFRFAAATSIGLAAGLLFLAAPGDARVKVNAEFDKTFDFRKVRTWAWRAESPGEVKMVLTKDDDPESVKRRYEPTLVAAVQDELTKKGLTMTASGPPDLRARYFVLISASSSAQELGQFVPWSAWSLPPVQFGQTQSLRIVPRGSILLDFVPEGADLPVWRGVAQAEIHLGRSEEERAKRLREAVRDLIRRFPPGGRR